jgi:hypothetical protein
VPKDRPKTPHENFSAFSLFSSFLSLLHLSVPAPDAVYKKIVYEKIAYQQIFQRRTCVYLPPLLSSLMISFSPILHPPVCPRRLLHNCLLEVSRYHGLCFQPRVACSSWGVVGQSVLLILPSCSLPNCPACVGCCHEHHHRLADSLAITHSKGTDLDRSVPRRMVANRSILFYASCTVPLIGLVFAVFACM